jgi:hypothetical protein
MYEISYYWGVPLPKVLKLINVIYLQTCFRNNEVTFVKKSNSFNAGDEGDKRSTTKQPRDEGGLKQRAQHVSRRKKYYNALDGLYRLYV